MRITTISAMTVKAARPYALGGITAGARRLPSSEYQLVPPYRELYGARTESMITRIETADGMVGWGESQAPVGPEVAQSIVSKVLAPLVLGRDPRDWGAIYQDMYDSMRARGQTAGYQLDAMAGIDIALWDLAGKAHGVPVSQLLGGRLRDRLPCYVSGLVDATAAQRRTEARSWIDQGFVAVKSFLGHGVDADLRELDSLLGDLDASQLFVDALWRYPPAEALALGRGLDRLGVRMFEAPIAPEDLDGHALLARALDVPVAGGEALRTRFAFLPWLRARALDVAQPDVMRNGITETVRIAQLAETFNVPVALHNGAVTVIGMAATWQLASTLQNFHIQEYQPQMVETFSPWLTTPLSVQQGHALVPRGPGLGIDIDETRLRVDVADEVVVRGS